MRPLATSATGVPLNQSGTINVNGPPVGLVDRVEPSEKWTTVFRVWAPLADAARNDSAEAATPENDIVAVGLMASIMMVLKLPVAPELANCGMYLKPG